jgi:hypothetical protein
MMLSQIDQKLEILIYIPRRVHTKQTTIYLNTAVYNRELLRNQRRAHTTQTTIYLNAARYNREFLRSHISPRGEKKKEPFECI